jgi:hypothetical protein
MLRGELMRLDRLARKHLERGTEPGFHGNVPDGQCPICDCVFGTASVLRDVIAELEAAS